MLSMQCCDYGVEIYPEMPNQREARNLLDGNAFFSATLAKRSCQTQNPCETYRKMLGSKGKRNATKFPCRFSPGKLEKPSSAADLCLQPNIDDEYFGSCAVVTEQEFNLLVDADKSRQRNKPLYRFVLMAGVGCIVIAALFVVAAVCVQRRSPSTSRKRAVQQQTKRE